MNGRVVSTLALVAVCVTGCSLPSLGERIDPTPSSGGETVAPVPFEDAYRSALETALVTSPGRAREYRYKIVDGGGRVLSDQRTVYNPDGTISALFTSPVNPDYSVVCLSASECYTNIEGEPFWWKATGNVLGEPYKFDPSQPITPNMSGMDLTMDGATFTAAREDEYRVQVVIVDDTVIRHEQAGTDSDRLIYEWRTTDPVPIRLPDFVRD